MSVPTISAQHVTKDFLLQHERTLKDVLPALARGRSTHKLHTALQNVSFAIEKGESVGVVGKNGAGKSTLMKLIAGVTYPTKGQMKVVGRVAPLIELGAGFHHELSGYENIFLNAAILGMHRSEIEAVKDEIIAFSEIESFLNEPLKRLSTGMVMRLAFSIAVHIHADILLIDEVLAVGDADFQRKCIDKLEQIKCLGTVAIVYISHDEHTVTRFCDRALLLTEGKLVLDATPADVFTKYHQLSDHSV